MNVRPNDFPALEGRTVQQRHVDCCAEHGHATHTIDGVAQPVCPRCGEVTDPAAKPEPQRAEEVAVKPEPPTFAGVFGAWRTYVVPATVTRIEAHMAHVVYRHGGEDTVPVRELETLDLESRECSIPVHVTDGQIEVWREFLEELGRDTAYTAFRVLVGGAIATALRENVTKYYPTLTD